MTEAQRYWTLVKAARRGESLIERTMATQIDIPKFYDQATNPRIISQLSSLMHQKGITHAEAQSPNASC